MGPLFVIACRTWGFGLPESEKLDKLLQEQAMDIDPPDVKLADSAQAQTLHGDADFFPIFSELIRSREEWLMDRILFYAKRQGYARYTSTLKEAWRLSISGLSASMLEAFERLPDLELRPDEDFMRDPAAAFGLIEAQRHRQRGVSLSMFLGLMKYYRQSYQDMTEASEFPAARKARARAWVDRFFDRVEIAFCDAWATSIDQDDRLVELQKANRSITNEKNKYLTVFESIDTAAVLLDDAFRVVNLNRAAAQLFGLETTPGSHYYQGLRGDPATCRETCQAAVMEPLREQLSGELAAFAGSTDTARKFEKSIDTVAGRRCFNVRLSRMLDVSEIFSGTVVLLEDLTERKRIADELARKERFLESVLNAIQDGISVLDADLNIMRVNEAMKRIHADAVPLEGKKCFEAYYGLAQPCDKCPTLRTVKSGKLESEEIVLCRDDESTAFLEVFAFPMLDDQGRLMGVVDHVRNVTARKKAEQAVQEHYRQYRKLFETCLMPILLIDPRSDAIVEANPAACRFYGYAYEKLTNLKISDINMLSKEAVLLEMQRALTQGRNSFSFRHRLSNGEIRDVEVFSGPIIFEQQFLLCSFVLDITERKILEEERLQREKLEAVLEIAGAVCHELNQPLMALGGYHELIRFNLDEQSPANKYLVKAHKQTRRMSDITSRLMCITRYETCDYAGGVKILDIEIKSDSDK
jgi:PAS domain S-box-containing protein